MKKKEANFLDYNHQQNRTNDSAVEYKVNPDPTIKHCRLISNGVVCRAKLGSWGLCQSHYQKFKTKNNGSLEALGVKPTRKPRKQKN